MRCLFFLLTDVSAAETAMTATTDTAAAMTTVTTSGTTIDGGAATTTTTMAAVTPGMCGQHCSRGEGEEGEEREKAETLADDSSPGGNGILRGGACSSSSAPAAPVDPKLVEVWHWDGACAGWLDLGRGAMPALLTPFPFFFSSFKPNSPRRRPPKATRMP